MQLSPALSSPSIVILAQQKMQGNKMSYSNIMTPPPAVSQPSLYTGVPSSVPEKGQRQVSWGGSGVANYEAGTPHLSGHQYAGAAPSFDGSPPFGGRVVDHANPEAMSRLKEHNNELMMQKNELRMALRDTEEKLKASEQRNRHLAKRADIPPDRYTELLAKERRASRWEDSSQRMTDCTERLLDSHQMARQTIVELLAEKTSLTELQEQTRDTLNTVNHELKGEREQSEQVQLKWSEAEQEVARLNNALQSAHADKQSLEGQLNRALDHASNAEEKMYAEAEKNLQLKTTMSELVTEKSELSATIENMDRRVAFLNKEIERDGQALSAINLKKNQLREELDSYRKNETRLQNELHNTKTSLEAANGQLTRSENLLSDTQKELSEVKKEALSLEQQLTRVQADKNHVSERARQLQTTLKEKLELIENLQTERARMGKEVDSLREEVGQSKARVAHLEQELKESEKNIKGLEQRIEQQVSELGTMHRMGTEFNNTKTLNTELQQKNQKLMGELETAHKQARDNRALYDAALLEKGKTDQALMKEQKSHKIDIENFQQTTQSQQELIQTHLSSISAREKEIRDLNTQVRGLSAELATAKAEGNKEEIQRLRQDVAVKEQKIAILQEQQRVSQTQIDTLREQVDQLQQKLAESELDCKKGAATINGHISIMNKAEVEIRELREQLEVINSIKKSILELKGGVQMTGKRMDDFSGRLQRCEEKIQEFIRNIEPIMNIPNFASMVNDIKSDLKGLGKEFSTIRTEQGQNENRLASLESRTELMESSSKTSVTIKREERSIESGSSSLITSTSGFDGVSQYEIQRGLAADLGVVEGAAVGQSSLNQAGVDSAYTSLQLQSQLTADGTMVSSRPTHMQDSSSLRGGLTPMGRYGDGFSSSEDYSIRDPYPDIQELLNENFDSGSRSEITYHSVSSTRDMYTMESLTMPLSGDSSDEA
ncbi:SMC family ATPase [Salinisphaera sp. G21_0]|uniref:SMC family ATPase n=1 Tax=Salinisphaera sp. G21_0 TaxID=2821094 RepID=UPI001AD9783A|nr:SMC family ATPase [Salinisphaera sp. G21_0]MBO9481551.1 SMC family ATPase [Salinisphaera sp. G21_0]